MIANLIEGRELAETVVASVVAGAGVTFAFSVAIWGVGRFADLSRNEKPVAAMGAVVVAGLALASVAGALVVGIIVMTRK
jgi:biotin transporter BioY